MLAIEANDEWLVGRAYVSKQSIGPLLEQRADRASEEKAGDTYVDAYEKTLKTIADFEERVVEASPVEWVTTMANTQADLLRNFAQAYADAARKALK